MIKVGITHGDFNGVGYEVVLKALADEMMTELFTPVVFACSRLVEKARKTFGLELPQLAHIKSLAEVKDGRINIVDIGVDETRIDAGKPSKEAGAAAVKALEMACDALKSGDIDILVTAPIDKNSAQSDSFSFPGHTEFLEAEIGNGGKARMILFDDYLKVALVTTHLPLSKIPEAITKESVLSTIKDFNKILIKDFGIERPKIAVLSLNPHCGDAGLLGDEEQREIIPAVEDATDSGLLVFGPFSADGFFSSGAYRHYDGVVAMYHDQGLAPFKALAGQGGVNFTAGLPYVRTSPDHGTGYDIAWKNQADPESMREAIFKGIDIFRKRAVYEEASRNPLRKARMEKGADRSVDLTKEEPTD